jgi:hypothetical protein
MNSDRAIEHLNSVNQYDVQRYVNYLRHIQPQSEEDIFKRWLFAYASVHTTWKLNCKLYWALAPLDWIGDHDELGRRIKESGAGMHNKRLEYIEAFTDFYWKHPLWFNRSNYEPWNNYRQRIEKVAPGIGFAKSAFGVELVYLADAHVLCTDTHILQLYGYSTTEIKAGKVPRKVMIEIQDHWVDACVSRAIPPVIGRWLYWDHKQQRPDSRYWTFVFEQENYNERLEFLTNPTGRSAHLPGHICKSATGQNCPVSALHEAIPDATLQWGAGSDMSGVLDRLPRHRTYNLCAV